MKNKLKSKNSLMFDALNDRLEKLEKRAFNQQMTLEFLLSHDRQDIVIDDKFFNYIAVTYVYNKSVEVACLPKCNLGDTAVVVKTTDEKIIVKLGDLEADKDLRYIAINKFNGEYFEITDLVDDEEAATVSNPDTPTETEFKYFTAGQVEICRRKKSKRITTIL